MNAFGHRPLAFGCLGFLASLIVLFYVNTVAKLVFLLLSAAGLIVCIILFFKKRGKNLQEVAVFLTPLLSFFVVSALISVFVFTPLENQAGYSDEYVHSVEGYVTQVIKSDTEKSIYIVQLEGIDQNDASFKVALYTKGKPLGYGSYFEASGQISSFRSVDNPYLEYGVVHFVDAISCIAVDTEPNAPFGFFYDLNKSLCQRFENNLNSDTSALFSALLLGNKSGLRSEILSDFSTLGLSHILALSGLHLTILVAIISFLLDLFSVPKMAQGVIIIFAVGFFVGLTGFSSSILRAGIMLILYYMIKLFAGDPDRITNLFVSVMLICLFSPFAVFSVSLRLSFLAMLGCIVGARLTRKASILKRFKLKPLYHGVVTIIATVIIIFFTLPILCNDFGKIALLSPIANLIFVPVFNLLIYLSLIFILFCQVPWLGDLLSDFSNWVTDLLLRIIDWAADIPNTILIVKTPIQLAGTGIIFLSMVLLLVVKREFFHKSLIITLIGAVILASGTALSQIKKVDNVATVGTLGYTRNDILYIEANDELVFFDMTTAPYFSLAHQVKYTAWDLGHQVIDSYAVTCYYENTSTYLGQLFDEIGIKNLYLAEPLGIEEERACEEIYQLATENGASVYTLEDGTSVNGMELSLCYEKGLYGSDTKATALSLVSCGKRITYLGASALSGDRRAYEMCFYSNIIIMGSHGPGYKDVYSFEAPQLESVIFLGKSRDYCSHKLFSTLAPIANSAREHTVTIKYKA
ncbi:MAG: ComEC/Rec2 family competence protein [Clostridia bacterium]|nr:ComEC/Rec2 family competence protein [Clostridia bacterium]